MANSFTLSDAGDVSVGNKKGVIGTATFTDGGATTMFVPLKNIQFAALEGKSAATYINEVTFTSNLLSVPSATSGDDFHLYAIGY